MTIRVVNHSHHPLPAYQTIMSAGMDLRAHLGEPFLLKAGTYSLIPTGLFIELPSGFEAQVRPRSGLALKHGITLLNSPGTIDADYRGEVKVLLINHSHDDFLINDGERIAQMVVARHETIQWELVEQLTDTERSASGFGSTGKH